MATAIKKYFLTVLFFLLIWPFVLLFIPIYDNELKGVTEPVQAPAFTMASWLEGDFQKQFEPYFSFHLGLRKAAVRTASQINYWLGVQRREVVVGKDHELMGMEYIDALYGRDFMGNDSIQISVARIRKFQQVLENNGVRFFIVVAPNKSRLYPKKIPEQFRGQSGVPTNYSVIKQELLKYQVPLVDFQEWFEQIDKSAPYPLFSNLGVHWSYYAATFCGDSLAGYIAHLLNKKANHIFYKEVNVTTTPYGTDKDMMELMNLWVDIPLRKPLAYFKTELTSDTAAYVPNVLTIGDSYYWNIIYSGIPGAFFSPNSVYFYYNTTAHFNDGRSAPVKELDLKKTILQQDVVFFLYSEPNLRQLGNNIDVNFLNLMDTLSPMATQKP